MPFDIAERDITPAARLAALIEAGIAANPDLKQGVDSLLVDDAACAIGFAALGAGATREQLRSPVRWSNAEVAIGFLPCFAWAPADALGWLVIYMNDEGRSLHAICESLRSGELSKVTA